MVLKEFDFEYTYKLKKFNASCTIMEAFHFPGNIMYRVVAKNRKQEYVHIFYKFDKPDKMFFWFPLPGQIELIAKSIADSLEKNSTYA